MFQQDILKINHIWLWLIYMVLIQKILSLQLAWQIIIVNQLLQTTGSPIVIRLQLKKLLKNVSKYFFIENVEPLMLYKLELLILRVLDQKNHIELPLLGIIQVLLIGLMRSCIHSENSKCYELFFNLYICHIKLYNYFFVFF